MRFRQLFQFFLMVIVSVTVPLYAQNQDIDLVHQLQTDADLFDVAWSPDGNYLAVAGTNGLTIYDPNLARVATAHITMDFLVSVDWHPQGTQIAGAGGLGDGTILIWDWDTQSETLELVETLSEGYEREFEIAWSPDGTKLASLGTNQPSGLNGLMGTLRIWNTEDWSRPVVFETRFITLTRRLVWNAESTMVAGAGMIFCEGCSPDYATREHSTGVFIMDATTGQLVTALNTFVLEVRDIAWTPDNFIIIPQPSWLEFLLFDGDTLQYDHQIELGITTGRITWRASTNQLAWSREEGGGGGILEFDGTMTNERRFPFEYGSSGRISGIDWHPIEDRLATVTQLGIIEIWNTAP